MMATKCSVSFWDDDNVIKSMVAMVLQHCEYTKPVCCRLWQALGLGLIPGWGSGPWAWSQISRALEKNSY